MEDPEKEIQGIIRALVDRPTYRRQEETLRRYWSPDCIFTHIYANANGLENLIALYQASETLVHYQKVHFHSVSYDYSNDFLYLRMSIDILPLFKLHKGVLEFLVHMELEDFQSPDGRLLKRIKIQRDYFQRSPVFVILPLIGDIYGSPKLRWFIGWTQAVSFRAFKAALFAVLPGRALAALGF